MIKCYDTLTNEYKDVILDENIETELKRSYWREEHAERRYFARTMEFNESIKLSNKNKDILDSLILKDEIEVLDECIKELSDRSQKVIYYKYYCDMSNVEIGRILGLSNSYIGKIVKTIKAQLKESILNRYEYYV